MLLWLLHENRIADREAQLVARAVGGVLILAPPVSQNLSTNGFPVHQPRSPPGIAVALDPKNVHQPWPLALYIKWRLGIFRSGMAALRVPRTG